MLSLHFEGWLECRLATDPDPTDEPRGVSGWTFAVAGEHDLDRIIRLQPEDALNRALGPQVGVRVHAVSVAGEKVVDHPLQGAPVELLGDPVFDGRNGIVAEDALEPIVPFHIRISHNGITLRREHKDRDGRFIAEPPVDPIDPPVDPPLEAGIGSPASFRAGRKADLERALQSTTDETQRVALQKRIADFTRPGVAGIALNIMQFALHYRVVMTTGRWAEVHDTEQALGGTVGTLQWIASFWVGAWDADALCAFMKGRLDMPFRPD